MARKPAPASAVALRVLRDHDYRHTPALVTAFKAGTEVSVAPDVARALIGAGAAEPLTAQPEE